MNNEDIKKKEFFISQKIKYVESKQALFNKLHDILPSTVDEMEVSTAAGSCILQFNEIFMLKSYLLLDMDKDAIWIEQKTKELEELKNGIHKQS